MIIATTAYHAKRTMTNKEAEILINRFHQNLALME
jgi:hypothetical protein